MSASSFFKYKATISGSPNCKDKMSKTCTYGLNTYTAG